MHAVHGRRTFGPIQRVQQLNPLSFLLHPLQRPRDLGHTVLVLQVLVLGVEHLSGVGGSDLNPTPVSSFFSLFMFLRTHLL